MTKVKICGIQTVEHGLATLSAGADYIGFVFARSKRQVTEIQAKEIIEALRKELRPVKTVGVFVGIPLEEMERIADTCDLDILQLHGTETAEDYKGSRYPIIKSVSIQSTSSRSNKSRNVSTVPDDNKVTRAMDYHREADYLLFDTWHKEMAGGSGETFEWTLLEKERLEQPFFLAGGLNAENVRQAIDILKPYAVDVSSGVETEGVKDIDKINNFIKAVKEAKAVNP